MTECEQETLRESKRSIELRVHRFVTHHIGPEYYPQRDSGFPLGRGWDVADDH